MCSRHCSKCFPWMESFFHWARRQLHHVRSQQQFLNPSGLQRQRLVSPMLYVGCDGWGSAPHGLFRAGSSMKERTLREMCQSCGEENGHSGPRASALSWHISLLLKFHRSKQVTWPSPMPMKGTQQVMWQWAERWDNEQKYYIYIYIYTLDIFNIHKIFLTWKAANYLKQYCDLPQQGSPLYIYQLFFFF